VAIPYIVVHDLLKVSNSNTQVTRHQ